MTSINSLALDEQTALLDAKMLPRNRLLILLLLDAGLRVGELVQLTSEHVFFSNTPLQSLEITSDIAKNSRSRIIPLTDRIQQALKAYHVYTLYGSQPLLGKWLFPSYNASNHITTRQVRRIVHDLSIHALGKRIHPHVLRHTFATRLMQKTSMRIVQELLGHSNLTSTQIYTHPNHEDLKNAIQGI